MHSFPSLRCRKKPDKETSAENASGLCIVSDKSDNEEGDTQEKTDVFDDTVESLQRIAHPTGLYIIKLFQSLKFERKRKKVEGEFGVIHFLSYPTQDSVNGFIDDALCSVNYTKFDEGISMD